LDERAGKLRIATNLKPFAEAVLGQLAGLRDGVTVDGISIRPEILPFGPEAVIALPEVIGSP